MNIQKLLKTVGAIAFAVFLSVNSVQAAAYTDVNPGDWYYESVQYVSDRQIMTGLDAATFGPGQPLARAQFAMILHRMAGSPAPSSASTFADVAAGEWYSDAVAWASSAGIVTGYTDTNAFMPSQSITRQEIATMMHRFARYEGQESEARSDIGSYPDAAHVSSFSYEAMQWSTAHELVKGDRGNLNPQSTTNRAECSAIIQRYLENDWIPIGNDNNQSTHPSVPENSEKGQAVVDYARQWVGKTPYKYGGNSLITGTDCSGFVQQVYANFEITLPRTTWEQEKVGTQVEEKDMQPGDLVFFSNYDHVGIYSGNGMFIHAPTKEQGKVAEESLKWMGPIKTVKRVLK